MPLKRRRRKKVDKLRLMQDEHREKARIWTEESQERLAAAVESREAAEDWILELGMRGRQANYWLDGQEEDRAEETLRERECLVCLGRGGLSGLQETSAAAAQVSSPAVHQAAAAKLNQALIASARIAHRHKDLLNELRRIEVPLTQSC